LTAARAVAKRKPAEEKKASVEPQLRYAPGKRVFSLPQHAVRLTDPRVQGRVHHGFLGRDGTERYIIEYKGKGKAVFYAVHAFEALSETVDGPTNHTVRSQTDKEYARSFLIKVGILTRSGKPSKRYFD
jgi:hypothetical protein